MDTVTHALSGAVYGIATGGKDKLSMPYRTRAVLGAAAAAFPDSDFVIGFFADPLTYLNLHRGVTHSLVLLPVWATLLGLLFRWLTRGRYGWRQLTLLAAGCLLVHIGGDLVTAYGTRIFSPLYNRAYAFPITFIIDLLFTGILLAGLVVSVWAGSRRPAAAALLVLFAYLGTQSALRLHALGVAQAHAVERNITAPRISVLPQPLSPLHWKLVVATNGEYRQAFLHMMRGAPRRADAGAGLIARVWANYRSRDMLDWQTVAKFGVDDGERQFALSAWQRGEFGSFREFAAMPYLYDVTQTVEERCAWFSDLRFQINGMTPPFRYGMCRSPGGQWRIARLGRW